MTPILFEPNTTDFNNNNGVGLLTDVLSCYVTEELNGLFELSMTYPVHGIHYESIVTDAIITAPTEEFSYGFPYFQPFRIYRVSEPINGVVTVNAQHYSYMLNYIPVMPITAASMTASDALTAIKAAAGENCPFNFSTDITTTANFGVKVPTPMRSILGGVEGSFLDVYGGQFEWSYPYVYIRRRRGEDRGFRIEYGHNMTNFLQDSSTESIVTGICPYARNTGENGNETILTLPEKVIESQYASLFPFKRTVCVDLTEKFSDKSGAAITEEELRTAANTYITSNAVGVPKVSISVSFVETRTGKDMMLDYSNVVHLGDTVTVNFVMYNIMTQEKVVKTVFDVLMEKFSSVTIGSQTQDLANTICNIQTGK